MFRFASWILIFLFTAVPGAPGITPGQTVPDFKAADLQGNIRTLDEFIGKAWERDVTDFYLAGFKRLGDLLHRFPELNIISLQVR